MIAGISRDHTLDAIKQLTSTADGAPIDPASRTTVVPARAGGDNPGLQQSDVESPDVGALVERAQHGDTEAFGIIYDRYSEGIFRFIYFRVGNRPLAEDLTSDTFLRALKRIGSFTWQGRDLGAWLATIARNLVADHFKSGRYRLEVTTGDVLDADREDRGPEGSPETTVVDRITNVALLTAVKLLNPEQRECVELRFLQGFSVAETAQAMGKNEGSIKALQYRGLRALARLLPDGFEQDINFGNRLARLRIEPGVHQAAYVRPTNKASTMNPYGVRTNVRPPNPAAGLASPLPKAPKAHEPRLATDLSSVDTSPTSLMRLSLRQRQIIRMLLAGETPSQISVQLGLAPATVRVHLSRAMHKLSATNPAAQNGSASDGQEQPIGGGKRSMQKLLRGQPPEELDLSAAIRIPLGH